MHAADITFVILTKNEAHNIADCLLSLPSGSAAIVYDTDSSDNTLAIAASLGAQVIQARWNGFVRTRAAAAASVKTSWTFMLDADERLSIALRDELDRVAPAEDVLAFSVARRNWFCGKWLRSAGWWPDRLVRLFRTGRASVSSADNADVHETWTVHGHTDALSEPLEHFSYRNVNDYWRKFRRYTDLEAASQKPSFTRAALAWASVPFQCGWLLLCRGGLMEGWRGMLVSVGSSLYPAVAATKSSLPTQRRSD